MEVTVQNISYVVDQDKPFWGASTASGTTASGTTRSGTTRSGYNNNAADVSGKRANRKVLLRKVSMSMEPGSVTGERDTVKVSH